MAESLLIEEAPPFVEDIASSVIVEPSAADAVGGTLPAAAIQFADLTESGSESGDEPNEAEQQQLQQQQEQGSSGAGHSTPAARSSPPPNCAICLSRCRRKCFTDSCMHQFCFKCLCEWSKIKPECPLCKQPFKTIIHNVRTLDDYDRYPVQSSSPEHSALSFHIVNIRRQRLMLQNQGVMTNNDGDDIGAAASDDSQDGTSNTTPSRFQAPYTRFEPYRMELLNFYRNDQDARSGGSLSMLWRRYVYDRKLYAMPVSDNLTGQFREWSARFYRDNPAQMHRLMPWINRDIVCLLRTSPQNVSPVMHMMQDILPMINIPTRTFRRRLTPFLGERTNHFIHELFNFARSPYDMIGYDRVVQYSALLAEEVEVDLLDLVPGNGTNSPREPDANANSGSNANGESNGNGSGNGTVDSGTEWSRMPRPSTSVIVTNPSATHSFSVTMATDGSELPGISIRRTTTSNVGSQTVAINLSMRRPANEVIEIDDGDAAANAEVAAINDSGNQTGRRQAGASLPISAHIELQSSDCSNSSDDDDECVFVLERKPPHLRTPELVSLDSNSDSDVVFVDEQKLSTPPKPADVDSVGFEQEIASAVSPLARELFMGPSTSTGVCSTSGKNWKMVLEEARRQDLMRSGRPKRRLTRTQHRAQATLAAPSSNNTSDATHWTTSSESSSNSEDSKAVATRRKRRAARKPTVRKRVSNIIPPTQLKSKRRRKQVSEVEVEEDEPQEEHAESSSDSSSSSSSSSDDSSEEGAAGDSSNDKTNNLNENSSSTSSDGDSTENLILSTLRDTLKTESVEDRKPLKRELDTDAAGGEETLQQQPQHGEEAEEQVGCSAAKRRRSCNSSSNLSSHSQSGSNSVNSTLASHNTTMSSCSALSLFNSNRDGDMATSRPLSMVHAIANSLLELSTLSVGGGGSGLFNEQSQSVEDAISYLRNTNSHAHDDDAQLGIYSDASNELQHYQTEAEPEMPIDVVGEANSSAQGESVDATDHNDNDNDNDEIENQQDELGEEQDEQDQEQGNDEDYDDEENDAEEEDDDAAAAATADSDATESDLDLDAY
ncbi:hypothetical protein ACLKA6_015700 [Drosophila palustris]